MVSLNSAAPHSHRDELLRTWLVKFSANHQAQGKEPAVTEKTLPIFVQLWAEEFSDIPTDALESAFRATIRTIRFFPTIADIRAQIQQADAGGFALEAEQAWEKALDYAREYFIPDQGVKRGAPPLAPAIEFAVRAAGGLRWLESCPESELQWARKRFIESYTQLHQTGQVEHLLTRPEAKRILSSLAAGPRALPAPRVEQDDEPDDPEARANFLKQAEQIAKAPEIQLSDEELRQRAEDQKRRLAEWLAGRSERPRDLVTASR